MSEKLSGTLFSSRDASVDVIADALRKISQEGKIKLEELERRVYEYKEIENIIVLKKTERGILMLTYILKLYPKLVTEIAKDTKLHAYSFFNYANDYIHFSIVNDKGNQEIGISYNADRDDYTENRYTEETLTDVKDWLTKVPIPEDFKFYQAKTEDEKKSEFANSHGSIIRQMQMDDHILGFDLEEYMIANDPYEQLRTAKYTEDFAAFRIVENKYFGLFAGFDSFKLIVDKENEREKEEIGNVKREMSETRDEKQEDVDIKEDKKVNTRIEKSVQIPIDVPRDQQHIVPKVSEKEKKRIEKFEEFATNRTNLRFKLGAVATVFVLIFGLFIYPIYSNMSAYGEFSKVIKDDVINVCKVVSEEEFEEFYKNNFDIDSLYKPVLDSYDEVEKENTLNEFKEKIRDSYKESSDELNSCFEKLNGASLQTFINSEISVNVLPKSNINPYSKYNVTIKYEGKSLRFTFENRDNNFKAINFVIIKN